MSGTVGTDPSIYYELVPCGGVVSLQLQSSTVSGWSLTRYVDQGGTLVSGTSLLLPDPTPAPAGSTYIPYINYIDIGEGLNAPLNQSLAYAYTFTVVSGGTDVSITTPAISVGATLTINQDDLTQIFIRVMQAGLNALIVPNNFKRKPSVFHAMPVAGQPTLPFVAISQVTMQQVQVPIGQNVMSNYQSNLLSITDLTKRRYSIAIMTTTAEEREFYRDAVISIFKTILGPLLESIGQNVSHDFMVDTGQVTQDRDAPGFYYCECLVEITGTFNVTVSTNYGFIADIDPTPSTAQDASNL